jgi:SAM-dependent methyltransferase
MGAVTNFLVRRFPYISGYVHYLWNVRVLKKFRAHTLNDKIDLYDYSKDAFKSFGPIRSQRHLEVPFSILSAISDVDFNSLLCIGPRFTVELFVAASKGFELANIKALDLFSFSDLIEVGDMHDMPYESGSFANVMAARLLAYSKTPEIAALEMLRVLKPGGYLYVSGDALGLESYDRFFKGAKRVVGLEGVSLYSSKYPDLQMASDNNCVVAVYKKDP